MNSAESRHNRQAPYWAAGLFIFCATGLATDPWDLLAYVSILLPLYVLDLWLSKSRV